MNIVTLSQAMEMLKGEIYIWKIDTEDDDLVKVIKDGDIYILEPVKSWKGYEI
jgi:hypothetical protein